MTATQQLPLIDPSGPRHRPAAGEVRLLVFNAQHAAPGRARRQAEWIAAQEAADLVVISEVGSGPRRRCLDRRLDGGRLHIRARAGSIVCRVWHRPASDENGAASARGQPIGPKSGRLWRE